MTGGDPGGPVDPADAAASEPEDDDLLVSFEPDFEFGDTPDNPLSTRQRVLTIYLRVALAVVFACAVIELAVPSEHQRSAGTVMVAALVIAPLGRIAWLVVRWARKRDLRFAAVGVVLLTIVATGFLVS